MSDYIREANAHELPFVIVVWNDAWKSATNDVTLLDVHERHSPAVMQTIGWLLLSDEEGVRLANERALDETDGAYRGETFIPKGMVKEVIPVKFSKPRKKKQLQKEGSEA